MYENALGELRQQARQAANQAGAYELENKAKAADLSEMAKLSAENEQLRADVDGLKKRISDAAMKPGKAGSFERSSGDRFNS